MDINAFETLHVGQRGAVVTLRFEHGKANEVSSVQLAELERLAEALETSDEARALVTWSERRSSRGTPIFVSGADVTERVGWDNARVMAHVREQRRILARLRAAPVFHVAVVAGVAFGWGCEYMLTADYRIAADGARFALPETGLGILPGAGGTSEWAAQIGLPQALRLGMTGESVEAAEALRIGLVQEHHSSADEALARAFALAEKAATRSPTANGAFKAAALASAGLSAVERTETEAKAYEHCVVSGEAAIGRANFAAARKGEPVPWGPRRSWSPDDESPAG